MPEARGEFQAKTSALALAPSPLRRHRFVQITCLVATVAHTAATLACVYTFREGNFADFSPAKLMQFVPQHLILWRVCCLLTAFSSISKLVFILAMREVLEEKFRFVVGVAVCISVVACSQDLEAIGRMMVLFADISLQGALNCAFTGPELVQIGWTLINNSITQTFMFACMLYGAAGLLITLCLTKTRVLPPSLAWAHLPVWLCIVLTGLATFFGYLPMAMCLMFAGSLGLSFLSAFTGMSIDSLLGAKNPGAKTEASKALSQSAEDQNSQSPAQAETAGSDLGLDSDTDTDSDSASDHAAI